jgi:membrane-associated phospholipid phosphatase
MEKKFAKLISIILHPLLSPFYALLFFYNIPFLLFNRFNTSIKILIAAYIFFMTFFVPAMLILMLKKNKAIKSLQMESRQERMLPLAIMSIIYYITYYFLKNLEIINIYCLFLLGITLITLLTLIINFYSKISLHMIGIGGLSGTYLGLLLTFPGTNIIFFYLIIIISGIVAYSRIVLTNHTVRQLFYGYLLGFSMIFVLIFL